MKRILPRFATVIAALAVLTMASCSLFGPSDSDVQAAFGAFSTGVASASSYSITSTGFTATSADGSVTVTLDATNSKLVTETYVFKDYKDTSTGYTINGTVDATVSGYTDTSSTYSTSMLGNLTYTGGTVTSLDFHIDSAYSSSGYTYSGYVTANGIKKWTVS